MGKDLTAEEMFVMLIKNVGHVKAETDFNLFKKAFEETELGGKNFNWDALYNTYFGKIKSFAFKGTTTTQVATKPVTPAEVKEQDTETTSNIEEDATPIGYNQDNTPIKYKGRKTAVASNKVPFLGVKYRAVHDKANNTVTYVTDETGELNSEGIADLSVVLNPDILVPGKEFSLEIPEDWENRTVSEWKYNSDRVFAKLDMTMRAWMDRNNIKEGSLEWINKVPMDMKIDGVIVGSGVHDVQWWNTRNVADFREETVNGESLTYEQAEEKQGEVISEGRRLTSEIRQNVLKGNNKMVITEREEGHTLNNSDEKLVSVAEANSEVQIAVFSSNGLITNKDNNQYFKGEILNKNSLKKAEAGHTYMLARIGTEKVDGKLVPTYVAYQVHTNHNQEALQELVRSRERLYHAVDIFNKIGDHTNPTNAQTVWANKVIRGVKNLTGVNVGNISVIKGKVARVGMGRLREMYPIKVKGGPGFTIMPQMDNIESQKLAIIAADGTVTNYVSKADKNKKGYKAMLMDNLHTQKKFYTIQGKDGKDLKVLDIQPKIKFGLASKVPPLNEWV